MIIKNDKDIILPKVIVKNLKCTRINEALSDVEKCPICKNDPNGEICIPWICIFSKIDKDQ